MGKTKKVDDLLDVFEDKPKAKKTAPKGDVEIVKIIFNINSTAKRQLDILAAEEGSNKTKMIHEALNDLFLKYEKSPIA